MTARLDTVRTLLAGCCVSCSRAPAGDCGRAESRPAPPISTPGSLESRGPLSPEVQKALREIAGREPTRDNRVRLLIDGTASFGAMLDLLEGARSDIRFENFIFRDDTVGRAFAQTLRERSTGAYVRVLYDPFGSVMSRRLPIARKFRGSAVAVRVYNPLRPTPGFFRRGRDHRKLVIEDERRFVAGGMCLADVWSGNCIRHCTWRDSAVLVEGSETRETAREFDSVWAAAVPRSVPGAGTGPTSPRRPDGQRADPRAGGGEVPVRILAGLPGEHRLERVLRHVFSSAEEEILVTNPYFLPTEDLLSSLQGAAHRGVTVEILLPAHNNHRVAGLASEHLLGPLLEAGVRVWRWLGPMIHSKTVVVDGRWSVIGSSNLDALSLRRNLELDVEIHGSAMGEQLRAAFARDRTNCRPYEPEDRMNRSPPRRAASRLAHIWRGIL